MNKEKLLIITGPTGVGKTKLAMKLYDEYNCVLISADSLQVYKNCNIGTAKISDLLLKLYPHYLINIKEPNQEYSVAEFKKTASEIIIQANADNKLPIIVGGTGLYIESLLFDYDFKNTPKNEKLREKYNILSQSMDENEFKKMLQKESSISNEDIGTNNIRRIIRKLEIANNNQSNSLENNNFEKMSNFDYEIIFLNSERQQLYDIINNRVDEMISSGLIDEAKFVYNNYKNMQVAQGIGYKEFFDYFEGKITKQQAVDLVKQHSRNYAKRQITWFKRYKNINFFNYDDLKIEQFICNKYCEYKKKKEK